MLEAAAVTFPGAHGAERVLSDLRAERDDAWLSETSVIEHDEDGRYSVKAKNPEMGRQKAGTGAAIGGLTGLVVGLAGGPVGFLLWGTIGAITGGGIGAHRESAFLPMMQSFKDALPADASMLVLVAETAVVDAFVGATGAAPDAVTRQPLTAEQIAELEKVHREEVS